MPPPSKIRTDGGRTKSIAGNDSSLDKVAEEVEGEAGKNGI
jgi:hypothetical protein